MKKNLVLLGMMAVGKTTMGKIVAKNKNLEFIDIDSNIEKNSEMTISEIFEKKGEKFFRDLEEKEVLKIFKKNSCVIALGGGAFINKNIRGIILNNAITVWLDIDTKILDKRTNWNVNRPLLKKDNNLKKLEELYSERKKVYSLASHKIDCNNLSKKNIVKEIIKIYEKY